VVVVGVFSPINNPQNRSVGWQKKIKITHYVVKVPKTHIPSHFTFPAFLFYFYFLWCEILPKCENQKRLFFHNF
jgi:hypothetical protein